MRTSESIDHLSLALSKAQGEMTGAKKGADNPFFKSHYSDLTMVIEAISQPFANNELAFVQGAEVADDKISVKTRIIHSSGQWIEAETTLPPTKEDAQGYGSAITYAKRYGLQALAGVPSIDDDGNAAVAQVKAKPKKPKKITAAQVKALEGLIEKTGSDTDKLLTWIGASSIEEITVDQQPKIAAALQKKIAA